MAGIMVIKVQQLKKTSFDRILAFSAEGSGQQEEPGFVFAVDPAGRNGAIGHGLYPEESLGKGKVAQPGRRPVPRSVLAESRTLSLSLSLSLSSIFR